MTRAGEATSNAFFAFDGPVEIIAHRGFSARAPENTLASMRLALEHGADAVEFDLHLTKDGVPVLLHDDTLNRTTDRRGRVDALTRDDLVGVDAGSWFDDAFAAEPVPTLAGALSLVGGRTSRVYAEVKDTGAPEDAHRIVDVVRAAGLLDDTVFISMDWVALDRIRERASGARIGYIVEKGSRTEEAVARARGDLLALIDFDARILMRDPSRAARAYDAGIALAAWTVDRVEVAERLRSIGVPRITTNQVEALVAWKGTL